MNEEPKCLRNIGDLYFAINTIEELFPMMTMLSEYIEAKKPDNSYVMVKYLDAMRTVVMCATDHLETVLEAMREDINKTQQDITE